VVTTLLANDVAEHTAKLVLELICQLQRPPTSKKVVHLGFAGGYSMQRVVRALANLLKEQRHDLPKKLVFHALVGGFDVNIPGTAPNAFLALFDDPMIQSVVETEFVLLHAPPIVHPNQRGELLELPSIREAYESVRAGLDIILTSAGSIKDKDSVWRRAHAKNREQMDEMIKQDGCVGDMLWLPLSRNKPLDNSKYPYRAMTLLELTELPELISRGTKVVLSIGPCGRCDRLKTDVLTHILNLPTALLTHMVVDSRTTRCLLGM
jgi:DNA-binding transcriptional regulator LsrR (DeoR family)